MPVYRALDPKGKMPTVVIDGRAGPKNPVIQTILARTFPRWLAAPGRGPRDLHRSPLNHGLVRQLTRDGSAILDRQLEEREWLHSGVVDP
jgi:hypothetical protein